jgi:large subunit ribosomal protein L18
MNVYRSLNHIYVQVIDDRAGNAKGGVTIAAASTMDKAVKEQIAGLSKTDAAKVVGTVAAQRAMEKGVTAVVFDRGGYLYTGRVKAVADGAREAGLKF